MEVILTKRDFTSDTWLRFKEMAQRQLDELRSTNDYAAPESVTAHNRGRIAELKFWLELDKAPPTTPGHP